MTRAEVVLYDDIHRIADALERIALVLGEKKEEEKT